MIKGGLRLCRLPPDFFSATYSQRVPPMPPRGSEDQAVGVAYTLDGALAHGWML